MPTRRQFLTASSALCALSALPQSLLAQVGVHDLYANGYTGAYTQGLLTLANFEAVKGSTFTVLLGFGEYGSLTLESVTSTTQPAAKIAARSAGMRSMALVDGPRTAAPAVQVESFCARFRVHGEAVAQQTYLLDHGTLGQFSALLVPSGDAGNTCTATFSYMPAGMVVSNPAGMQASPIQQPVVPIAGPVVIAAPVVVSTPGVPSPGVASPVVVIQQRFQ